MVATWDPEAATNRGELTVVQAEAMILLTEAVATVAVMVLRVVTALRVATALLLALIIQIGQEVAMVVLRLAAAVTAAIWVILNTD